MEDMKYLEEKRKEVLEAIKPICEVFGIKEYDYLIQETGQTESLFLNGTKIACSGNSISAIVDELIGYIFVKRWTRNRTLGAFQTQTLNVIKRCWL